MKQVIKSYINTFKKLIFEKFLFISINYFSVTLRYTYVITL